MPARSFILTLTMLALLVALVVPPVDLPETVYNESDSPFVALRLPAVHLDSASAQLPVIVNTASIWVHDASTQWRPVVLPPSARAHSLPIILQVLLC